MRDPAAAVHLTRRARALVDYALKLTQSPDLVVEADIALLHREGLSEAAIHDAAAVTAYFNFVNRTASGLGVVLEAAYLTPPAAGT